MKFFFRISDCCLSVSRAPMCRISLFTVGCPATRSEILSFMSETVSLGKHKTFTFLLPDPFTCLIASSPTMRQSSRVIFTELGLLTMFGVAISLSSESVWSSGLNLLDSCKISILSAGGFLALFLTNFHCLGGVDSGLGSGGQSDLTGLLVLPVSRWTLFSLLVITVEIL